MPRRARLSAAPTALPAPHINPTRPRFCLGGKEPDLSEICVFRDENAVQEVCVRCVCVCGWAGGTVGGPGSVGRAGYMDC